MQTEKLLPDGKKTQQPDIVRLKDEVLKEAIIENEKDSKPFERQLYLEIAKINQQQQQVQ